MIYCYVHSGKGYGERAIEMIKALDELRIEKLTIEGNEIYNSGDNLTIPGKSIFIVVSKTQVPLNVNFTV